MPRRKTHEEFLKDLYVVNPYVEVLSPYEKSNVKVSLRCKKCGSIFSMRPNNLLSGQGCPECGKARGIEANSKTHEQYVDELQRINPAIRVLGEYTHNQKGLLVQCAKCGHTWSPRAATLLKGHGCPKCSRRYRRTHEEFVEELESVNPDIIVLTAFSNMRNKIELECKLCHERWKATPRDLMSGKGCPYCYHTSTSYTEQFILLSLRDALGADEVMSRDRDAIGKELDIYVPSKHFAIEPGAWDWHKGRLSADAEKRALCKEAGIRLVSIYDGCPKDSALPFETDCYTFQEDLAAKSSHAKLVSLAVELLEEVGAASLAGSIDWNAISKLAYRRSRRRTTKELAAELSTVNPSVQLMGEYRGAHYKTLVRCKKCRHEWEARPADLRRGIGCPACAGNMKKTHEQFLSDLARINPAINVLGEYHGSKTRIEVECSICHRTWSPTPNELLVGHRCPSCHPPSKRKTQGEFEAGVFALNPNIEVVGTYEGMAKHVEARCKICGQNWNPIASTLYYQQCRKHIHD